MAERDAFLDEWASVGLTDVTLPSGYQVRIRVPEPRDLIVRGLLPPQLIGAVLEREATVGMAGVSSDDPELTTSLLQAMTTLAADMIRQARKSADEDWRPVTVTPERFGMLPDADREMLQDLAMSNLGADEANAADPDAAARAKREGAAGTVDAYAGFRDGPDGDAGRPGGADVRPASVDADRPSPAAGRTGDRRGARRASRKG